MAEINLLPQEERSAESFGSLRRKLLLVSIVVLVLTGLATMGVLFAFASLNSQKEKLITRIEDSSGRIESMKAQEELIVVTKSKASTANQILNARQDMPSFFTTFAELMPLNVYFIDLRIGGNKFTASGRARTSGDVAGFVSSLISAKGSEIVSDVNIDSLSSDDQGIYTFVVNMQLVSEGGSE